MKVIPVTTPEQFDAALAVRFEVFVGEQGVSPESERDHIDDDPSTVHALVCGVDGEALATGRLIAPHADVIHGEGSIMDPANPHIGRVAVCASARGTGAGRAVMEFLEAAALARYGAHGTVRVELSAQDQAMPFYQRLGYTAHGAGYLDEGIPHHDAYKDVS